MDKSLTEQPPKPKPHPTKPYEEKSYNTTVPLPRVEPKPVATPPVKPKE